jgi:hypothetical protein
MKDHIWLPLEQENQQSVFKKKKKREEERKEKTKHRISMLLTKDRMERRVSATRKIFSRKWWGLLKCNFGNKAFSFF